MVNKRSDVREITAICERSGAVRNNNSVRDFNFLIDQSERTGGTNEAPTPMEYVLGSFNGCVLIIIERVANDIGFSFQSLKGNTLGTVDRRGLLGVEGVSPHFQKVKNTILFETEESQERIQELKKRVQKICPVYNLFKDAGIEIELNWVLQEGGVIDE